MYCAKCGARLGDGEEKCPLCDAMESIHVLPREQKQPMYPQGQYPEIPRGSGVRNGVVLFLFALPLLVSFFVDMKSDGMLSWFYYVAGATVMLYVIAALPGWFYKPNPVIFVPCSFAAVTGYLLLIDLLTQGGWFLGFAFPMMGVLTLIVTTVVVLTRYLLRGRLYVFGGAGIALGLLMVLVEWLTVWQFDRPFVGWSVYPLIALGLLGGLLIFLGINKTARERMERRFFL